MRVKDGDTIVAKLDQGFDDEKTITVRLSAVYCPESKEPGGAECRAFTEKWFADEATHTGAAWPFVVTTVRMKVADHEQETLSRYVAVVTSLDGLRCLNTDIQEFVTKSRYGPGITVHPILPE